MKYLPHRFMLSALTPVLTGSVFLCVSVSQADANGELHDSVYDCLIEPFIITDVGSATQGIVSRLLVDRGETVLRGQALVELESSVEKAAAEQAGARAEMLGEVVTREADLELANLDSKRFSELYSQGLTPAQQHDEAVARKKMANAALVQALENRKLTILEYGRTQRALEQRTIKSPVDGVVVNQLVFPGELVFDNPVVTVADLDPLRVEVVLPARLFGTISSGDTAQVLPEVDTDEPLYADVDVVDPLLDSRSGTFGVRLLLPNPDFAIPAGQKCQVSFRDARQFPASDQRADDPYAPAGLGAAQPASGSLDAPPSTVPVSVR